MLTIAACVIAADFLTGLVHWWEDTYGNPTWPLIGSQVIEPNILHHEQPSAMVTMGTLFTRNYQTAAIALLICAAVAPWWYATWPVLLTIVLAAIGNEVHACSHRKDNPAWIRFLQDAAVIQTPRQHAKHHRPPFNQYYCTLTNITNAVLERIHFWRSLEWFIRLAGIEPTRGTTLRRGV